MATPGLAPKAAHEDLADRLGYLQRRARTLRGDATDRLIRSKLGALSIQIRRISVPLMATHDAIARVIASEVIEAALVVREQLEQDAHRFRLRRAP